MQSNVKFEDADAVHLL